MITFLVGQSGPHTGVLQDLIIANGINFSEELRPYTVLDSDNKIKPEYKRELLGYVKKINHDFYTNSPSDVIAAEYIKDFIPCRVVYVDYPYDVANNDFAESVNKEEYNEHQKYIDIALSLNIDVITVDYTMFINDFEYRDAKILEIIGPNLNDGFIESLDLDDPELGQSYFSDLVAQHHDLFAGKIVSEILNQRVKFDFDNQEDRENKMYRKINGA